jgi:hypothetical protein
LTLALLGTHRTGFRGVLFFLQHDLHTQPFGFVGELMVHQLEGSLVGLLILHCAFVVVLTNISNIPDDDRLHALSIQCGNQMRRLFMFDVLNLVFEFLQLFFLRANESDDAPRPTLFAVDELRELGFELIGSLLSAPT